MISYLGSLVRSCCREGGVLQTDIAVCGEHSPCSGHTGFAPLTGVCFPRLHCSGSRLLYMERALRCLRFQFSGSPQKRGLGCAGVLCLPRPSSSGSQELAGCTLPGCGAPSPLPGPSLSSPPPPCRSSACALCLATTLPADVDHPESQEVFG